MSAVRRLQLVAIVALGVALLVVLPGHAIASPGIGDPVPMTESRFVGVDGAGTSWEVHVRSVAKPYLWDVPAQNENWSYWFGEGLVTLTSMQSDAGGGNEKSSFTVRVKYNFSVDYFGTMPDAGAGAGICGYVIDSSGEGVPAVGEFYEFLFWDGAHGLAGPDGTTEYFPDRWYFVNASDTPIWLRSYQRSVLLFWYSHGDLPMNSGWSVSEGDIRIRNALVFDQ